MSVKAVFFDLDGTLLPMDETKFTKFYFSELAKEVKCFGIELMPLSVSIWKGVKAMVKNDGTMTNYECFWISFFEDFPQLLSRKEEVIAAIGHFYETSFANSKIATGENPLAVKTIRLLQEQGYPLILATNPIFPYTATATRMSFVGLKPEDFRDVSAYENCSYAKPNPQYYMDMLERNGLKPEEVLMIGNDFNEDVVPTRALGMRSVLVSECLLGEPDDQVRVMPFAELYEKIRNRELEELYQN
ncbi:MAG: HAD family hydrolase [Erysipelotrichaceae bacterium]|nr:HAD family hydrolase [Erysipelotrichaceae bacterium]